MALLRLWWVPKGETADKGAYISYPVQDLLGILALESQRQRCMVIGEDLGTVPPKLSANSVFSWKVIWFEQQRDGRYRLPGDYPRQSIARRQHTRSADPERLLERGRFRVRREA